MGVQRIHIIYDSVCSGRNEEKVDKDCCIPCDLNSVEAVSYCAQCQACERDSRMTSTGLCLCVRFISINFRCGWSHTPTEGRHVSSPSREIPPGWPEPPSMPSRGPRNLELLVPDCMVSTQRTTHNIKCLHQSPDKLLRSL